MFVSNCKPFFSNANMKSSKIVFCCVVGVASLCFISIKNNKKSLCSELALSNIEALAQNEDDKNYDCFGVGCLDCPAKQIKVAYIREY